MFSRESIIEWYRVNHAKQTDIISYERELRRLKNNNCGTIKTPYGELYVEKLRSMGHDGQNHIFIRLADRNAEEKMCENEFNKLLKLVLTDVESAGEHIRKFEYKISEYLRISMEALDCMTCREIVLKLRDRISK